MDHAGIAAAKLVDARISQCRRPSSIINHHSPSLRVTSVFPIAEQQPLLLIQIDRIVGDVALTNHLQDVQLGGLQPLVFLDMLRLYPDDHSHALHS